MRTIHRPLAALIAGALILQSPAALAQASAAQAAGRTKPSPLAPGEIVAQAPEGDWAEIPPEDLLVMDLEPDAKGKPRRVVIQLMPAPFSKGWTGNIRKLVGARFWDGLSINRVQDNYVVQWGDGNAEDKAKARALPADLEVMPESQYETGVKVLEEEYFFAGEVVFAETPKTAKYRKQLTPKPSKEVQARAKRLSRVQERDSYAEYVQFLGGWPLAVEGKYDKAKFWPVHCYGMVGVGRDMPPNTGTGAELYVVIGHAPRHLDRNIALVGRVIEGIEHLSSLPRGTLALGFYATPEERTGIRSIRLGSEVEGLPAYEYLNTETESFAKYADARANRRDDFFIRPAGGADICNIPVPVRRVK